MMAVELHSVRKVRAVKSHSVKKKVQRLGWDNFFFFLQNGSGGPLICFCNTV